MQRRQFFKTTAAVAVTAGVTAACATQTPNPAPATSVNAPTVVGQAQPTFDLQIATSFPTLLDTLFGGVKFFADRASALTKGNLKITPRAAGELAPATGVLDAVSQGTVPMGYTSSFYYISKSPVLGFGTAMPFGLVAQQQNAWLYQNGGLQMLQDYYRNKFGIIQFPAGNTGVQMGGWFRKQIQTVADLQGLKMRIPGLGGQVMTKLGVTASAESGDKILPALQAGNIDAAEWTGPYDDAKLGLAQV